MDSKYFIDSDVYNCPFCNRRHVRYTVEDGFHFHWSEGKRCYGVMGTDEVEGNRGAGGAG